MKQHLLNNFVTGLMPKSPSKFRLILNQEKIALQ